MANDIGRMAEAGVSCHLPFRFVTPGFSAACKGAAVTCR